jgi:hypothetical protein
MSARRPPMGLDEVTRCIRWTTPYGGGCKRFVECEQKQNADDGGSREEMRSNLLDPGEMFRINIDPMTLLLPPLWTLDLTTPPVCSLFWGTFINGLASCRMYEAATSTAALDSRLKPPPLSCSQVEVQRSSSPSSAKGCMHVPLFYCSDMGAILVHKPSIVDRQ